MNKAVRFIIAIFLSIFLLTGAVSAGDAPGYKDPGSRVPPRTPVAAPKPKPKPKPAPRRTPKPAPVPVPIPNPLNDGKALLEQGLYESAKAYLLRAVKEQANNPYAWYYLGLYYEKTGDFMNAQKNYTVALRIDRQFPMLSRVVIYPNDPYGKIPLWDPVRPARIEQVNVLGINGISEVPLDARSSESAPLQTAPAKSEAPVYLPPDPNLILEEFDMLSPVYVPPIPQNEEEVKK